MASKFAQMTECELSFDYPAHILMVLQSLQDFTYVTFKGFVCAHFLDLAMHHIEWEPFDTLHA